MNLDNTKIVYNCHKYSRPVVVNSAAVEVVRECLSWQNNTTHLNFEKETNGRIRMSLTVLLVSKFKTVGSACYGASYTRSFPDK